VRDNYDLKYFDIFILFLFATMGLLCFLLCPLWLQSLQCNNPFAYSRYDPYSLPVLVTVMTWVNALLLVLRRGKCLFAHYANLVGWFVFLQYHINNGHKVNTRASASANRKAG
jgi:hypothetical protein